MPCATGFGHCIFYSFFELMGAALAALAFRQVRPTDFGATLSPGKLRETLVSELLGM